jgi:hypothetical protein
MANTFMQTQGVSGLVLIWDEDGILYRVPRPIIGRYRLSDAQRVEVERELLKRAKEDADQTSSPLGPDFITAIPPDVLAPYRLSDEELDALASQAEVQGHEQIPQWAMGYGPTGMGGTWGSQQLSSWWIIEMNQQNTGPYAGLRDIA